jgi:hypothetical protein
MRRDRRLQPRRAVLLRALVEPARNPRQSLFSEFCRRPAQNRVRRGRIHRMQQRRRLPRGLGPAMRGPALSWRHLANLRLAAVGLVSSVIVRAKSPVRKRHCVALLVWLLLPYALACEGERTTLRATSPDHTVPSSGSPDASSSGGPPTSTLPDGSSSGGQLSSTPGGVRCGSTTCARDEQCCLRDEGSPASVGCAARSRTSCLGHSDWRGCDETADCNPGELCCLFVQGLPATLDSFCIASPPGGSPPTPCGLYEFVGCGSDDDCRAASAPPCVAQRCRGDIVQTCGLIPSDWCPP